MARPIRWLHLSDLHLGCRGKELWWTAQPAFEKSIRQMVGRRGAPHLVLFTGDLVNTGQAAQFKQLDQFLADLFGWIRDVDSTAQPVLVPVPGNHDVQRPKTLDELQYSMLADYGAGKQTQHTRLLHEELWHENPPSASRIGPLFENYLEWFENSVEPRLEEEGILNRSHFPGDFTFRIEPKGAFPLLLVALNATWQQYRAGNFNGKLTIPSEQYFAALPNNGDSSPLPIFDQYPRRLLLMHQPPSWLSTSGRQRFEDTIFPPNFFDLCLHGHLHKAEDRAITVGGGEPRYYYQAASLFGASHWDEPDHRGASQLRTEMGYAWGELAKDGAVHVWPMCRLRKRSGRVVFEIDHSMDQCSEEEGLKLRDGESQAANRRNTEDATTATPAKAQAAATVNFDPYLHDLIDQTKNIKIQGLSYSPGSMKTAQWRRIEDLYIPLRVPKPAEVQPSDPEAESLASPSRPPRAQEEDFVSLAQLVPKHRRLLIEGKPGAGKSTFLDLVACMLARDLAEIENPKGGSWREQYLGMDPGAPPLIPVLLNVSDLVRRLADKETSEEQYDNRNWLLDLLGRTSDANKYEIPISVWETALTDASAILLLDGLDEVDNEDQRQRVFAIVRNACEKWQCPMVITSRPIGTQALIEQDFFKVRIADFDNEQIKLFIANWVRTLGGASSPVRLSSDARQRQQNLEAEVLGRPEILKMASSPVMLTCLCVVHWNEGELPDGRSKVYRAILTWLVRTREKQRKKLGWNEYFAMEGLSRLALAMMTTPNGKVREIDLVDAVKALQPMLDLELAQLTPEVRRKKGEEWLRFECLASGTLSELPGNQFKFWHLTFQEYLAARRLKEREQDWWPEVRKHLTDEQWRETIEMLPGCLYDGGRKDPDRLLRKVYELRAKNPKLRTSAQVTASLEVLLQALQPYQYTPRPELTSAFAKARDECLSIFSPEGAREVPIKLRLEAARVLGRYGDPRLAEDQDNFLAVPGLAGLRLGRYPVTVEEYARFVDDGGYAEKGWWRESWSWLEKNKLLEPGFWQGQLQTPNHPVIGVSWYEAHAYCAWLTDRLGKVVARLPSDEEWEKAATPEKGEFPWGGAEPTAELANYGDDVGRPSPVGLYPGGEGPNSHCDLAGNVWEWCEDARNDLGFDESEDVHSLRGGSWAFPADDLRSAVRSGGPAGGRNVFIGFRVAVVPASS